MGGEELGIRVPKSSGVGLPTSLAVFSLCARTAFLTGLLSNHKAGAGGQQLELPVGLTGTLILATDKWEMGK